MQRIYNVLNLGAGIQSSRVFLGACLGELPRLDVAIFADTRWEPRAVYDNVQFLTEVGARAGIPVVVRSRGDIRRDAIEFRRMRASSDGKRFASLPTFVRNADGSRGKVKRQCTKEYKIEVVESYIRYELIGLEPRGRMPADVLVHQWFGISDDEASRAVFPGISRMREITTGTDLFGNPIVLETRTWNPTPWKVHIYPLLNEAWHPDRTIREARFLPVREDRGDCMAWLADHYPGRTFPRSACIGCPLRGDQEWREMRDHRPEEWADACDFDDAQRQADADGMSRRKIIAGLSYVHDSLVPLRVADIDAGGGRKGGGCGTLFDGLDGMCDV